MIELSTVYQHSKKGRNEIVRKCHGLTRSERLALIVMDGITPADEIRERLGAMNGNGFEQAIDKLLSLGLINEVVFAPVDLARMNLARMKLCDEIDAPLPRLDALASVTVVRNDPHYDFSVAALAAAPDFSSLCPTASTAIALEEWTRLRGWHVKWHAQPVKADASARRSTGTARNALRFSLPWSPVRKRPMPDSSARGSIVPGQADGKRPFAISVLVAIAAVVTGTMAVVR